MNNRKIERVAGRRCWLADERGITAMEYAALIALVLLVCIGAFRQLGSAANCGVAHATRSFIEQLGGTAPEGLGAGCPGDSASPRSPGSLASGAGERGNTALGSSATDGYPAVSSAAAMTAPGMDYAPTGPVPKAVAGVVVNSGFGPDVDAVLSNSPTALANLGAFQISGGKAMLGMPGKGTYYDPATKTIFIDPNIAGDPLLVARELSHELSHGTYPAPPATIAATDLADFQRQWSDIQSKNEATAAYAALQARQELLGATHGQPVITDLGVEGKNWNAYLDIYNKSDPTDPESKAAAIDAIAKLWGSEEPSNNPGKTYQQVWDADAKAAYMLQGWKNAQPFLPQD